MATGTPQHDPHASEQLLEGEWFDEIVVGPDLETLQSVVDRVTRGQEDDGHVSTGPQLPGELETVSAGQADVEDDEVGHRRLNGSDLDPIGKHRDGETLVFERGLDTCPDRRLVFDDDDAGSLLHRSSIARLA